MKTKKYRKSAPHRAKKKSGPKKPSSHPIRWRRRLLREGATYHVSARANRGENIFEDPVFKEILLGVIERAKEKYAFYLTAFVIMSNHFHLNIKPAEDTSLPRIMQWILSVFAMRYNKLKGLEGHVFQGRYFSRIIETPEDYETVVKYIEQNPVEAKLVRNAQNWRYSSAWFRAQGKAYMQREYGMLLDEHEFAPLE